MRSAERRGPWGQLLRQPLAALALAFLALLALAAVSASWLAGLEGIDPGAVDLFNAMAPPSAQHWLGTDELGRDLFYRLLLGGQVSLAVGLSAALGAAAIGTAVGLLAGERGGWLDAILMRSTDAMIALPLLPILIVLSAVDLTKLGLAPEVAQSDSTALFRLIVLVALVGWTTTARLVRAATRETLAQDYVLAARAMGARPSRILWRHVLPNILAPLMVATTLSVGQVILFESVLSFLGLGLDPGTASWGRMLAGAQDLLWEAPALALYPGLAIAATVVACNLAGDGLAAAFDPRRSTNRS
ncbi:MAG: ABC transporter permease [Rhodospirillales bacterium]